MTRAFLKAARGTESRSQQEPPMQARHPLFRPLPRNRVTPLPILATLLLPVLLGLAMPSIGPALAAEPLPESVLPWRVRKQPDGSTEVLGLRPGYSTLREVVARVKQPADLAARAGKPKAQPSGSFKQALHDEDLPLLATLTVQQITYVPLANYPHAELLRRFGEPPERLDEGEHSRYWLWPELGLALRENDRGRETFYYVHPDAFVERIRARLEPDSSGAVPTPTP